ncbi:MAG: Uridine kinase [Chloroflexi bacterium ADurb.Bin360]|nr:MAG: Uridine kinase [Chloroflexi bacterium ADurb.Bin360]
MRPLIIGVAGGTGSGKTTVANRILERVGTEHIAYIPHDAYYRDLSHLPYEERQKINFDHPNSLETELMVQHLVELRDERPVEIPVYDFTIHTRTKETRHVDPARIVLAEGILIFAEPELRPLFDVKLFVDTDADIRLIRRLQRDVEERGRTVQSVIEQYLRTVRPMHLEFVEPSKRYADVIIPEGGFNEVAIEMVAARIRGLLQEANGV